MDKNEIEWGILKGALVLFSSCIILSAALISGSLYFDKKIEKELRRNKSLFQSISRKYLDVDQEEKLLLEYYPKFVALYKKGIIGREKRLDWIEVLRQSGEKIQLPSLKYTIKSQELYRPGYQINYSGYALYRSSMDLKLGLLHEGDLFKLLNYINNNAVGTYTISDCEFNQGGSEIQFNKNHANVTVSCTLSWITIDLPGGNRIEI